MPNEPQTTIYTMKLHETLNKEGYDILRVAGGWIYKQEWREVAVFVPFDNEFQEGGRSYAGSI